MAGVNKVIIIGNLGNNPDIRTMQTGETVTTIGVATSESWTDKQSGDKKEVTEWHRIIFYRRLADIAGQYLLKGSKVYVEGRLKTRKWQAQDGTDRYVTEIIADKLQMLDSRKDQPPPAQPKPEARKDQDWLTDEEKADFDDDIPF